MMYTSMNTNNSKKNAWQLDVITRGTKTNIDAQRCLTCLNDNNENKKEQTNKYKKIYIAKKFVCL